MTKAQLMKALHQRGIRYGERDGKSLKLSHLRWYELVKMYDESQDI